MEVRESNLYQNGEILIFEDGSEELVRSKVVSVGSLLDTYYTVMEGDRLDLVAYEKYKHIEERAVEYWWLIADVNDIENPFDLSEYIGVEILIPDLLTFKLSQ